MAVVVSLRDLVDELQTLSNESHAYLHKSTGEVISVTDDDFAIVDSGDDWHEFSESELEEKFLEHVEKVRFSDEYLELPSQFDIHEYEIMERFCLSIPNEKISDALLDKIHGSGAFRRFKDSIYRYGIEKDWFKFRDEAYKEIAISWLESKGFAYSDDMNRREQSI
jgi:hypothetical protein